MTNSTHPTFHVFSTCLCRGAWAGRIFLARSVGVGAFTTHPKLLWTCFTEMMANRVEANIRWDWDLNPALWSLSFASKVNLGVSMSIKRCLRRSYESEQANERNIGEATARIFQLLRNGDYLDGAGRRCKVSGDVSKITQIIGLTPTEKMLLRNYHFMSSRLPGTRQVRRTLNHLLFSARVIYGTPAFITVTPSERHSGLAVHLFRYRRNDPAIVHAGKEFSGLYRFQLSKHLLR